MTAPCAQDANLYRDGFQQMCRASILVTSPSFAALRRGRLVYRCWQRSGRPSFISSRGFVPLPPRGRRRAVYAASAAIAVFVCCDFLRSDRSRSDRWGSLKHFSGTRDRSGAEKTTARQKMKMARNMHHRVEGELDVSLVTT